MIHFCNFHIVEECCILETVCPGLEAGSCDDDDDDDDKAV
jgi:hypothetical protein